MPTTAGGSLNAEPNLGENSEQSQQPSTSPVQGDEAICQRTIYAFERQI